MRQEIDISSFGVDNDDVAMLRRPVAPSDVKYETFSTVLQQVEWPLNAFLVSNLCLPHLLKALHPHILMLSPLGTTITNAVQVVPR